MVQLTVKPIGIVEGLDHPDSNTWKTISVVDTIDWSMDGARLIPMAAGRKITVAALIKAVSSAVGSATAPSLNLSATIPSLLSHVWSAKDVEVEVRHPIPDQVKDVIFHWVRWTVLGGGERKLLVRTHPEANTWELSDDPWATLAGTPHPQGGPVLAHIVAKVTAMQKDGSCTWGVEVDVNQTTGKVTKTITPFLVMAANSPDEIKQDMRFLIKEPKVFSNDPDTPCFSFFPLDNMPLTGSCEHWLDFESQFPEKMVEAWRAAFFGIFYAGNRSRQMIYLYDNGRTGKSNMIRAITKCVSGSFYAPLSKDSFSNQFWGTKIYGRRLIVFSDSGNTKISQMDKVKQISGGDPIDLEFKGSNSRIQYTPDSRVIITTNRRPEINVDETHQSSRALVFPLTATTNPQILKKFCMLDKAGNLVLDGNGNPQPIGAHYDRWMASEFYDYLELCREPYHKLCPNDQDILVPAEMTEYVQGACATAANDATAAITQIYLQVTTNEEDVMTNADLRELVNHVSGNATYRDSDLNFEAFCDALKLRGATRSKPFRYRGAIHRGWCRVKLRPGVSITATGIKVEELGVFEEEDQLK